MAKTYSLQTWESKKPVPTVTSEAILLNNGTNVSEKHNSTPTSSDKSSNNAENQTVVEVKTSKHVVRFLLLGLILMSNIYSFVLAQLVTVQYMYAYIHKAMYPNASFTSNESQCLVNTTSPVYREQQAVQKATAQFIIYTELAKGIPAMFSIFLYGSLSDKYGRRLFLLIPFTGNMLKCILITVGVYLNWNIYVFILFFFVDGVGGGWVLAISTIMSMVADITDPGKTRTFVIAMVELSLGLGAIIGSFTSGFIIKAEGFKYALLISSCCSILPILLLIFLPETLNKGNDQPRKSAAKLVAEMFVLYFRDKALYGKRKIFFVCLLTYFFIIQATFGAHGIETLYGLNSPFCWSSVQVGTYITLRNGLPIVAGLLFFRPLQMCLDEGLLAVLANLSNLAGFVLEAFAYSSIMLYFVPVLSFLRTMAVPIIRGVMSRLTPQDKQGTMFAGLAITETFCTLFGNVASNAIYGQTVEIFRGAAFLVLAGYAVAALVLSVVLYKLNTRMKADKPVK